MKTINELKRCISVGYDNNVVVFTHNKHVDYELICLMLLHFYDLYRYLPKEVYLGRDYPAICHAGDISFYPIVELDKLNGELIKYYRSIGGNFPIDCSCLILMVGKNEDVLLGAI